jgi:hypothetical protein
MKKWWSTARTTKPFTLQHQVNTESSLIMQLEAVPLHL